MRRIWLWIMAGVMLLGISGCNANVSERVSVSSPPVTRKTVALVVKSTDNPYMLAMYDGFAKACDEVGMIAVLRGPTGTQTQQAQVVQALISEGIDAIAIAANDMQEVSVPLRAALDAGIPVVSLDSMVQPEDRLLHIQQASAEMIGRVLIQACAQIIDGAGDFAILTTTDTMPNQASWVRWMQQELDDHPEQYKGMTLVEIAYGLDEREASTQAMRDLLADHPALQAVIAPTTVGIRAAAEVIEETQAQVKLTGLGLPSEMHAYIDSGMCPWMYLWNPTEVGYLAAYALDGLCAGTLTGAAGEVLSAGELGQKIITASEGSGTELVLGNPKMFDSTNIVVWSEVF